MEFRLLGPLEVVTTGDPVDAGSPRQRTVLAALLVDAGRPVMVDTVIDRVWGQNAPARARHALYVYIARIRRLLESAGGMRLAHRSHGYLLDIDPDLVDAHRFTGLIARGRELHGRDEQRTSVLRQALDLWRGVPLAGMHGEWVMQVREAWRRQRLEAITMWARSEIRIGNIGAVIGPLTAIVAEEPLVEPLAAELMRALHTAGMSAEALTCYRHLRQRLAEELGIEPGADVQELHRLILKGSPESLSLVAQPVHSLDVPRQLPAAARTFIGRPQELQRLAELARQADRTNTVVISAIDGAAGVGKTSLAVHFGHQVAGRYPDGQLYLNLRGFDPSGTLLDPSTAVQMLLEALGVAPQRIPSILDAQSALLRSRLAGRRMLLVLDNARDAEQVRPLLPGTPGCLVLITSRHQLTSLCMSEGAELITIGLLSTVEARELLAARLGAERVGREPEAVAEIIARCGNLPLALVMVAARAAANPRLNLAAVVTALTETSTLDALDDIVSVFSWSYLGISAAAARLFRLLGLHPGPDVSIEAAASLAAEPISNTRLLLAQLTRAHLISEGPAGRYSFHDLVRQFASQQARRLESHAERTAAVERLLDHYLHAAHVADHLIDPHGDLLTLPAPKTGAFLTAFHDQQQAIRWFAEDRRVLLALVGHAADSGWNSHVYHLDRVVTRSLFRSGHWLDQVTTARAAVVAAARNGDLPAQSRAHHNLARAYLQLGEHDLAEEHLLAAIRLADQTEDVIAQGNAYHVMAWVLERQHRTAEAFSRAFEALQRYEAAGHPIGTARTLNTIGWFHTVLGNHEEAVRFCRAALTWHRRSGNREGMAATWHSLGHAQHELGRYGQALRCLHRCRELSAALQDCWYEAIAQDAIGDAHLALGEMTAARAAWLRALSLFTDLSHPRTDEVRAKLALG